MNNTNRWKTSEVVLMGLFAALTVVGTSIRVPLPALVGNPFSILASQYFH